MQQNRYIPYLMWLFPLLFFGYQFILRLWPGLLMESIMTQFSIDASGFGLLAAFYYYGYAGLQIPVALLLERFGAKVIITSFALLCGVAMFLFIETNNFYVALASRFLIGAGSAAGFLGVSKVISDWFPASRYASMIGFSFSIGLMGAIFGGKPVSLLITDFGWQPVALILSALAIIIGLCCFLVLKNPPHIHTSQEPVRLRDFKSLLTSPFIWLLAFVNLLLVGCLEGFADVWGVPFLITVHHMEKSNAALLVSFIFFGMLAGGPLLALCKHKFGNYPVIAFCGLGITLIFAALLMNYVQTPWIMAVLFFITGILCCYQVLVFAAGAEMVESRYLGVIVAFLNCINMLGGSFFHTIIGHIMDYFWQGAATGQSIRVYDPLTFQYALSIIPACALLGSLITIWMNRQCKQNP